MNLHLDIEPIKQLVDTVLDHLIPYRKEVRMHEKAFKHERKELKKTLKRHGLKDAFDEMEEGLRASASPHKDSHSGQHSSSRHRSKGGRGSGGDGGGG